MKPKISVIIVTKNRAHKLKNCLDSLVKQSYRNFEVLVVDGHSTDNTKEVAKKYTSVLRIKFFLQSGKGHSNACNDGIKKANGEFIAFIDDDVTVPKKWLSIMLKHFIKNPELGFIGGAVKFKTTNIYEEWVSAGFTNMSSELKKKYVQGCNMAFRKNILLDNLFDEQLVSGGTDTELQFRLGVKGVKCKNFNDLWATHHHSYKNIFTIAKQYKMYSKGLTRFYSKYDIGLLRIGDLYNLSILFMLFWAIIFYISNTITFSIVFSAIFLVLALISFRGFYKSNGFRKVGIIKKVIFSVFNMVFSTYMTIQIVKNRIYMKIQEE
jgi:glycosyltransferase involved in cell wall biosynthesis